MISSLLIDFLGDDFQVTCCADAESALRELGRGAIHVVLLDHNLPGGGSDGVAEQAGRDGLPMVWMTGDPGAVAPVEDSSHHLIAKPFNLDGLLSLLIKALGSSRFPVPSGA